MILLWWCGKMLCKTFPGTKVIKRRHYIESGCKRQWAGLVEEGHWLSWSLLVIWGGKPLYKNLIYFLNSDAWALMVPCGFMPRWILAAWQGVCIIMNCCVKWRMLRLHIAFNWCSHKSEINVSHSAKWNPSRFLCGHCPHLSLEGHGTG